MQTDNNNTTPDVLDDNDTNWLVKFPDGSTDIVSKSPMNRLLYDYDLWGLLKNGSDILVITEPEDEPDIQVTPNEDSTEFVLEVGNGEPLYLGQHKKSDLVDSLMDYYEDGDQDPTSLVDFYERVRSDRIRESVMRVMGQNQPFTDSVEVTADGWLIHDHLLLTWENEFYHPDTTSKTLSGSVIPSSSSEPAYRISVSSPKGENRDVTVGDEQYRLTDSEMEFLAMALWGITEAPTPEAAQRKADGEQGTPGLTPEVA